MKHKGLVIGILAAVVLALLACPLTWMLGVTAYDIALEPLIPRPDLSSEVARKIQAEYGGRARQVSVRQVNDIRSGTDFPFNYSSRDWGYRATYRVEGSDVVIRMRTSGPSELTDADFYKETFPSSIGVSVPQFVALLNAYAKGSGEREVSGIASMKTAVVDTPSGVVRVDGREYPQSECYVLAPDDFGSIIGSMGNGTHLVYLDPTTGVAIYLGRLDMLGLD